MDHTWRHGRQEQTAIRIRVETGSVISVKLISRKSKYLFNDHGLAPAVFTEQCRGDDILTLIPLVNWSKESHDYVLQVNDEYETECDSFLILQAVHCANVSMSMMTGGPFRRWSTSEIRTIPFL